MAELTTQELSQDSFKATVTTLGERAFLGGAAYLSRLSDAIYAQAGSAQARAATLLQELSAVTTQVATRLNSANTAGLDAQTIARLETLKREIGRADAFLHSASQAQSVGNNLSALGKSLGAVVGGLELLAKLNSTASQSEIAKGAVVAGVGILVGLASFPVWGGIAAAVAAGAAVSIAWDRYIAPTLGDLGFDLSTSFWDSLFDSFGLSPKPTLGTGTDPDGDGVADTPTFRVAFDVLGEFQRAAASWRMFRGDPLVLDLNGDGIQLVQAADSQANFDLNADGVRERVGWIGPTDGFLALDADGDGEVRDIEELFGSETRIGFEELAEHDLAENGGNADGRCGIKAYPAAHVLDSDAPDAASHDYFAKEFAV